MPRIKFKKKTDKMKPVGILKVKKKKARRRDERGKYA
tara:strand:+ start:8424 stop:8534 length:111 start_codon:yes stop_codon:yes gene_type:complete